MLPAAVLLAALDRPSRSTLDAAVAAAFDVSFLGALLCDSALPAAVFEPFPVEPLRSVCDAFDAAFGPVVLLAICRVLSGEVMPWALALLAFIYLDGSALQPRPTYVFATGPRGCTGRDLGVPGRCHVPTPARPGPSCRGCPCVVPAKRTRDATLSGSAARMLHAFQLSDSKSDMCRAALDLDPSRTLPPPDP